MDREEYLDKYSEYKSEIYLSNYYERIEESLKAKSLSELLEIADKRADLIRKFLIEIIIEEGLYNQLDLD